MVLNQSNCVSKLAIMCLTIRIQGGLLKLIFGAALRRGLSKKTEQAVSPLNIKAVFQMQSTIRQRVTKVKGRLKKDELKGMMYSIPYEGGAIFVRKAGQYRHTKLQQHKRAACKGDTNNGIAEHAIKTSHSIQWKKVQTITTKSLLTKWKVKKSLLIRRTSIHLNSGKGPQLDDMWYTSL